MIGPRMRAPFRILAMVAGVAAQMMPMAAYAEYEQHGYDSTGKLLYTCRVNSGRISHYARDAADNRSTYTSATTGFGLTVNAGIWSEDGRFLFVMQGDGNLVLYGPSGALWGSGTSGSSGNYVAFQGDGNLVMYGPGPIWASNTFAPCATLQVQNDGNVVIYNADGVPIWATNTGGH